MPRTRWSHGTALALLCIVLGASQGCKRPEPPPPPPPVEEKPPPAEAPAPEEPPPPEEPAEEKPAEEPAPDAGTSPDAALEVVDKGPKGIARFKMSDE
ncbi:MAG: hypothetical protein ACYTFM_11845, partial [Planctomycetota bacterium]